MRVLFDQGTPAPLRRLLPQHEVVTAFERGWSTDMNLKYQQNLASRTIAIVVLNTTSWPRIQAAAGLAVAAIDAATPGTYAEVAVP